MNTFERLRPSFSDVDLVYLQGWGEPLLHPKFWTMVRQAKSAGAMVGFTTNATLFNESSLTRLVHSGVDVVAVSLAGLTQSTQMRFRPGCDLEKIDAALLRLRELKRSIKSNTPAVHIAFILLSVNCGEVDGLAVLAERWGASQIVVSNLTWIGSPALCSDSVLERADLWPQATEILAQAQEKAHKKGIRLHYHGPTLGEPKAICTENVLNSCVVTWNGEVSPCVFTSFGAAHGDRITHYFRNSPHSAERIVFGTVNEQTLPEIWNSATAREFRQVFLDRLKGTGDNCAHLPEPCRHCYKLLAQ